MGILNGAIIRLSTSSKRNVFKFSISLIMYELNSILLKSGYSYLQYHWWPIDLIVKKGFHNSSIKYRVFIDGTAIVININMGVIVQIISIEWFFNRNRLVNLFLIILTIINNVDEMIIINIIIVILWNAFRLSANGEFGSWKDNIFHVAIFNKNFNFIYGV